MGTSEIVCESLPGRATILSYLRKFENFGNIFLRIEIRHYSKNTGIKERSEAKASEFINTCSTLAKSGWSF